MRLGMNLDHRYDSVEEWLTDMLAVGCKAVSFPLDYRDDINLIDQYVKAARENDILIAEVGCWCNPLAKDPQEREAAMTRCIEQLKLADYIGANCAVNCGGSAGPFWCAFSPENLTEDFYQRTVESIQTIIGKAAPKRTCYSLEPMPWIYPTGPDDYLRLMQDVGSEHFAAHLDMCNWLNDIKRLARQREFMDEVFDKLHGKIVCHHFKDLKLMPGVTVNFQEVPVTEGMLDVDYYVQKINEEDPDAPLLIEHLPEKQAYLDSMKVLNQRYYGGR